MNIKEYTEISKNVEVPDTVKARFNETMDMIKVAETETKRTWNPLDRAIKYVAIAAAIVFVFGTATISVRAYIKHLDAIKKMPKEEVVYLYEHVYKYDSAMFSRELSKEEDERSGRLFSDYSEDRAEPASKVKIIEKKEQYNGKGVAFCKEDGILYIPEKKLSDEEILECIEFGLIGHYIVSEGYEQAVNPDHYMNALKDLSDSQIEDIYVTYLRANTECAFFSRELTTEEAARRKALKKLYMYTDTKPKREIEVITSKEGFTGKGVAFCSYDCTYYLPTDELTDEDLLELIDYLIKQDYAVSRITEEVESGKRMGRPEVDFVKRERVETIDNNSPINADVLNSDWLKAYSKVADYYLHNGRAGDVSDAYVGVCFIFLNDDDIPEMLITCGSTDLDAVRDMSDRRVLLYTVKDGEAVQLKSDYGETEGFYAQFSPFSYVERKGMVLNEGHNPWQIFFEEVSNDNHDHINETLVRMDYWNFDTLTCTHSDLIVKLEHAVYDILKNETYDDAEKTYEYYLGVKEITRDEKSGVTKPIKGEMVDESTYESAIENLWDGEKGKSLNSSDFDKIYSDYNIFESLAKCYEKQGK